MYTSSTSAWYIIAVAQKLKAALKFWRLSPGVWSSISAWTRDPSATSALWIKAITSMGLSSSVISSAMRVGYSSGISLPKLPAIRTHLLGDGL